MVDLEGWPFGEEEDVVVDLLASSVQAVEDDAVYILGIVYDLLPGLQTDCECWARTVQSISVRVGKREIGMDIKDMREGTPYIARKKIEPGSVELVRLCEVRRTHAEVTQFMDGCRALSEPLRLVGGSVLLCRLYSIDINYGQPVRSIGIESNALSDASQALKTLSKRTREIANE